ncbi:MAG: prenyltransferase/squalene oxidase repeat-containing protein [Pirellulaceae bacterium]|nr:prenyltransferase/squalene oxidase repeat-containing protein [Pirellulaceae bacterium]
MSQLSSSRREFLAASAALVALGIARTGQAADETGPDPKQYETVVTKGIDFLRTKGQADDGTFTKQIGIGITSLAATAMLRHGRSVDDPTVAKALKALEASVQPTGGIHAPNGRLKTYETCVCTLALKEANKDGRYDKILANADKFLKEIPFDAAEGHGQDSFYFGGAGYGGQGRPDLSNTAFMIEALRGTGAGADDQAIQNALIFVSRCQNLESPHNTTPFAAKINDGGFYYTPIPGKEDEEAGGGLRSYGAMSYAGLKSLVFAGVKADDPRVKAVVKWIGKNYDVTSHPGQGQAGYFYYCNTFAKALAALGQDTITDDKGTAHPWRKDLLEELAKRQRDDGSWVNPTQQFFEGDANLCTSFALISLSYAGPKSP